MGDNCSFDWVAEQLVSLIISEQITPPMATAYPVMDHACFDSWAPRETGSPSIRYHPQPIGLRPATTSWNSGVDGPQPTNPIHMVRVAETNTQWSMNDGRYTPPQNAMHDWSTNDGSASQNGAPIANTQAFAVGPFGPIGCSVPRQKWNNWSPRIGSEVSGDESSWSACTSTPPDHSPSSLVSSPGRSYDHFTRGLTTSIPVWSVGVQESILIESCPQEYGSRLPATIEHRPRVWNGGSGNIDPDFELQEMWLELRQGRQRVPPPGYICHNCFKPGHYVKDCPHRFEEGARFSPYQGMKPCVAEFFCGKCKRYWLSHNSGQNKGEYCKKCNEWLRPKKQFAPEQAWKSGLYLKEKYHKYLVDMLRRRDPKSLEHLEYLQRILERGGSLCKSYIAVILRCVDRRFRDILQYADRECLNDVINGRLA